MVAPVIATDSEVVGLPPTSMRLDVALVLVAVMEPLLIVNDVLWATDAALATSKPPFASTRVQPESEIRVSVA